MCGRAGVRPEEPSGLRPRAAGGADGHAGPAAGERPLRPASGRMGPGASREAGRQAGSGSRALGPGAGSQGGREDLPGSSATGGKGTPGQSGVQQHSAAVQQQVGARPGHNRDRRVWLRSGRVWYCLATCPCGPTSHHPPIPKPGLAGLGPQKSRLGVREMGKPLRMTLNKVEPGGGWSHRSGRW